MIDSVECHDHRAQDSLTEFGPVGFLLATQQGTAVEQFSAAYEADTLAPSALGYRSLIPLTSPAPGQQFAFEVDLDACSGCKACVSACHNLNGLRENELWRSVGLLHGGTSKLPVLQHVTTACHHCVEPACLDGCPVGAYVKEPVTGIVRHLDDQCIGCQYCILKCPYDVPRYLPELGIVRKCDMCHSRLAVGEAPACVQSCPNQAIRISLVERDEVAENAEANLFLPGAAGPDYTLPTTQYKTRRPLPANLLPADYFSASRAHAHPPLVAMLVLTQMSVGAIAIDRLLSTLFRSAGAVSPVVERASVAVTLCLALVGALASVLHLGRPWLAYRAVLGWRTSWLSREVIAFGLFGVLSLALTAKLWLQPMTADLRSPVASLLAWCMIGSGAAALVCSTMIYASTRRTFWNTGYTGAKFALTAAMLGAAITAVVRTGAGLWLAPDDLGGPVQREVQWLSRTLVAATAAKLLLESTVFAWLSARTLSPLRRTALLLCGDLAGVTAWRYIAGVVGGVILPLALIQVTESGATPASWAVVGGLALAIFAATVVGEFLERYLFFAAVVAPKMPGGPAT